MRLGVVGAEHPHVYAMVASLLAAGAELGAVHAASPEAAADLADLFGGAPVRAAPPDVLDDPSIDVAVLVPVPDERAALACRAMESGRDVLVAKPAALTIDEVARIRDVQAATGRIWSVYLSERLEDRATLRAERLVADGAIGRVVHVVGSGPHRLGIDHRPEWFLDPARAGGILVDLATHQIDQVLHFTALTGARGTTEIVASAIANLAHPDHPAFADHGEVHLRRGDVSGSIRVDWLSPDGLPTWGDVRLFLHGTHGTIELRKNIDLAGRPGGDHLFLVDGDGVSHVDCADEPLTFAGRFLDDVITRARTHLDQAHVLEVCGLAVEAQSGATRHGHLRDDGPRPRI